MNKTIKWIRALCFFAIFVSLTGPSYQLARWVNRGGITRYNWKDAIEFSFTLLIPALLFLLSSKFIARVISGEGKQVE